VSRSRSVLAAADGPGIDLTGMDPGMDQSLQENVLSAEDLRMYSEEDAAQEEQRMYSKEDDDARTSMDTLPPCERYLSHEEPMEPMSFNVEHRSFTRSYSGSAPPAMSHRRSFLSSFNFATQRSITLKLHELGHTIEIEGGNAALDALLSSQIRNTNAIYTTVYTEWYSWPARSFWLQFHRVANVYFFIVAIVALTPVIHHGQVKVVVVAIVLSLQALKDLYEDLKKRKDDTEENQRPCEVYDHAQQRFVSCAWEDCRVGSTIKLRKGDACPADILIVASSDDSGDVFVSTKSLDGETNLKQRRIPPMLTELLEKTGSFCDSCPAGDEVVSKIHHYNLTIYLQPPDATLLSLHSSITIADKPVVAVSLDNFALRGCEIQNTA